MRLINIISFLLLIFIISGCTDRPMYAKKMKIDGVWSYDNKLDFPIEIKQLDLTYDLILSLTYGRDFGYQNIYVKIFTKYPGGKIVEDILSLNLTDGSGIFLGDCNSTKCEIDILLQEKFKFKEEGDYTISIHQNGRDENLDNIFGVELKLFNVSDN